MPGGRETGFKKISCETNEKEKQKVKN